VSTTVAPGQPPARRTAATTVWALPSRAIATFSGTPGLVLKLVLLGLVNALSLWAATILARDGHWLAVAVLAAVTLAVDAAYLAPRRAVALKFLIPGTLFLVSFQLVPIAYNVNIAFTNWSVGHQVTKPEAIAGIKRNSLVVPEDGRTYTMAAARDGDGALVLLLVDELSGNAFVGSRESLEPLPQGALQLDEIGLITGAEGYHVLKGQELVAADPQLQSYIVPTADDAAIRPEGLDLAVEQQPTLRYEAGTDTFTRISDGAVFRDNGRGSFVTAAGEELEPGWRTNVGTDNFRRVVNDPLIRAPFLRVFVWTVAFATLTVLFSFALGLFLAISLDKKGMRFLRTYRSLLVIPYAVPAFLSLLVWQGLLNDEFGVVNRAFGLGVPWLFDPNWAKVSIILVSVWLTTPYFFLISLGSLQSIPGELVEAARVDGAGALQVFRKITLPLLLIAVAPLLIASFAFNFNNFGNIYFLTGGGPASNESDVAGATDILISYTYKLAFESGKGQDYGLASAISIVIFFIVGAISVISFWRTRTLENVR
jgi:arabinogalactan oligomer / maltooligosaccharide transport system permease protein